ncbi:hypothetical protein Q7P37_009475 [Cladosporium fusiforme]
MEYTNTKLHFPISKILTASRALPVHLTLKLRAHTFRLPTPYAYEPAHFLLNSNYHLHQLLYPLGLQNWTSSVETTITTSTSTSAVMAATGDVTTPSSTALSTSVTPVYPTEALYFPVADDVSDDAELSIYSPRFCNATLGVPSSSSTSSSDFESLATSAGSIGSGTTITSSPNSTTSSLPDSSSRVATTATAATASGAAHSLVIPDSTSADSGASSLVMLAVCIAAILHRW